MHPVDAFWQATARRAFQARHSKARDDGYQQRSDVELRLGYYVGQLCVDDTQLGESDLKDKGGHNHRISGAA
jgi:hypothetical protein